ncbi:MAG: putative sugar nucleotidyl transferase [Pirellulaceae bacterium]|nr:putative sugar nucleotidyl transferase [Pirellulaceae bacterium]
MKTIVFEDDVAARLHPATIGRPTYAISCGGYRLIDWIRRLDERRFGVVRPHLRSIQETDFADLAEPPENDDRLALFVNARLAPARDTYRQLLKLSESERIGLARSDHAVTAAIVRLHDLPDSRTWAADNIVGSLIAAAGDEQFDFSPPLFEYPHDIVRENLEILRQNLEHRLATQEYREVRDGVFLAEGASLGEHVVSDTGDGPIVLDQNARIGPYCFLSGPAFIGSAARVIEHSAIKDGVSVGHTCKIGGEVEASVIEPYSNKQHYGFLGHSYLGSWINLGAGTCNSDLKNTYGKVNMEYNGVKTPTKMQFVGCIMGDYAKTAINTGIFTGKTIGACSMVYGFVTENVPSFVNYARLFGQVAELPPEVMIATQKRMFLRRDVAQRDCDKQLIHDMFDLTHVEREWTAGELAF